jgi:hypothetical protein
MVRLTLEVVVEELVKELEHLILVQLQELVDQVS